MAVQLVMTVALFAFFALALHCKISDLGYWVGIVGIAIIVNPAMKYWGRYFSGHESEDE